MENNRFHGYTSTLDGGDASGHKQGTLSMIKSELVQILAAENPHLFIKDVEKIVATIFDSITEALERGERVELRGFGAFSVKHREARQGRNPRTGEIREY